MGDNGETAVAVCAVFGFCISFMALCCKALYRSKKAGTRDRARRAALAERHRRIVQTSNQQEDIYNISSRVQGQEQGQWPTHDNHVSLDHFTITNEINKYNDDPPTYEEAMRIAASNNNNTVVAAVPKTNVTPTSTSTSTANQ
ncbi:uncharacterized protein LOC123011321 isoform X3 [Tribolium madens]|uniref:uncharacterized protein LOC123011321 isoform X3 n=1 Tax=Tribolium madens TaxID=41895 RepID=UPI001CF74D28|nr:uncharacterized protein LOC123011321 isoform X3 [Tribolium madens]